MELNEYQKLAARTINRKPSNGGEVALHALHALHGMASEVGEIHGIYQKAFQGHRIDDEHLKKELGDLMWFVAEFCTAKGWQLGDVCEKNIKKLEARYPDGFEAERSINRAEGDV